MVKIYLDNCCYNRPFDNVSDSTIQLETTAKLFIQSLIKSGSITLVSSFVLYSEIYDNPSEYKKRNILRFVDKYTKEYVGREKMKEALVISTEIIKTGIKEFDAAHIACAIITNCDFFISTDKRLLKYKTEDITLLNPIEFVKIWEKML